MRVALSGLILLLSTGPAFADQVTLKNGDRLTGAVLKSDGKTLEMKAELAGNVVIPWDAVTSLTSDGPLYVTSKDGQVLVGKVVLVDGKAEIETATAGRVSLTRDVVQQVRSEAEQKSYEVQLDRMRNPRLLDLWSGFLETGLALTRGNAETTNFNLGMTAARTTPRDKIGVHFMSLYARNSTTGPSVVTANATRGGVSYNLNLSSRTFAFGFTDLEFDQFQKLDLRFVGGGGMGWHALKSERTALDLSGGGSLNKEFFSTGLRRTSGEVLFGEELSHKLGAGSLFKQRLMLFPNLSESGEFRVTFDSSIATALKKWLAWHFTVSDRYLSNPLPGTKKNDVLFTTGLRVTFAR
jgi:uncharacterized protein DUF481